MIQRIFTCPDCGMDITPIVRKAMKAQSARGGSAKSKAQNEAHKKHAAELNKAYTPEKRKAAAAKRLATLAKKAIVLIILAAGVDTTIKVQQNAYGLGVGKDQYGRAIETKVIGQPNADTSLLKVKPNTYGPGIGSDQYGRKVIQKPK